MWFFYFCALLLSTTTFADDSNDNLSGFDVELPQADSPFKSRPVLDNLESNEFPAKRIASDDRDNDLDSGEFFAPRVRDRDRPSNRFDVDEDESSGSNEYRAQTNLDVQKQKGAAIVRAEIGKSESRKSIENRMRNEVPPAELRAVNADRPMPGCRQCFRWTKWLNADSPDGIGDIETLGPPNTFNVTGTISRKYPDVVCSYPLRMECREAITRNPWHLIAENKPTYRCKPSPGEGFLCLNGKQKHGVRCRDYETRLLCLQECSCFKWTEWINADTPWNGDGDFEVVGRRGHPKLQDPCDGRPIVDVQCQHARYKTSVFLTNDRNVQCTLHGLTCFNKDQANKRRNKICEDYEVRFLCQQTSVKYI